MARVTSLAGHPIEQHSSPNVGGKMDAHNGVVLHIAQGTYKGTINWQMNPDQRYGSGGTTTTSSTWIVGKNEGEWAQMSDSDTVAWCQRGGSKTWNSIELAGFAPDGPTEWQVEACAQLLAWGHAKYGWALAVAGNPSERGLGHHSMDREWLGEEWGHDSCPGAGVIAAKARIVARAKEIVGGGQGGGTPAPAPKPATRPAPGPEVTFPLPSGFYFGPADGPKESVSGRWERVFHGRTDRAWLRAWADQLARRGWAVGKGKTWLRLFGNDGIYGDEYEKLIKAFQQDQGLTPDGLLGAVTWRAAYRNPIR